MFKWLFTDEFRDKRKKVKETNERVPPVVFPKKLDNLFNFTKTTSVSNTHRTVTNWNHKYELLDKNGNVTYKKDDVEVKLGTPEWEEARKAIQESKSDLEKELDTMARDLRNMFK